MQITKFPHLHLVASGWYLDYSRGFVPEATETFYSSLTLFGPELIKLEDEPEEDDYPIAPTIVKEGGSAKGKGKGKRVASNQVSTLSYIEVSVKRTTTPATTVVGCPIATPSVFASDIVHAPSHRGVALPSIPRKRKAITPDTSATSSEKSSSPSLIENVNMEALT